MKVKVGKYEYEKSPVKNKKLRVKVDGKTIDFGDTRYQHFKDKTKHWTSLDHQDKKRRENYLTRSAMIKDKAGKLTKDNPASSNYHARRILW